MLFASMSNPINKLSARFGTTKAFIVRRISLDLPMAKLISTVPATG